MTENKHEIPKAYDPSVTEDKWYKYWLDSEHSHTDCISVEIFLF